MSEPSELAIEMAAQAWCRPETSSTTMDPVLAKAFAQVLDNWIEIAAQNQRNCDFYRGLLDECAEAIGPMAYTADDGSVYDEPVRLKIPEIVKHLIRRTT